MCFSLGYAKVFKTKAILTAVKIDIKFGIWFLLVILHSTQQNSVFEYC